MSEPLAVALVDDDVTFRRLMTREILAMGHRASSFGSFADFAAHLDRNEVDVLLLDVRMPGTDGLAALEVLSRRLDAPEVIMLTGHGSIDDAVASVKRGAFHYLTKPCRLDELEVLLGRAGERRRLALRHQGLVDSLRGQSELAVIGDAPALVRAIHVALRAAPTRATVLIEGETGTGKELVARLVHHASAVATGPFVAVNCGAFTETVLHSELFGHEKGAFTGADRRRIGLFEVASGGTIFLDEVGEITPSMQVHLLQVLQSGTIRRLGSNDALKVDVRVIAATNRRLLQEVRERRFREDLLYRLNTIHIELPPLRERAGDVPRLAEHFLALASGDAPRSFTREALARLSAYAWPGNVRELANMVTRLAILADAERITDQDVQRFLPSPGDPAESPVSLKDLERAHIVRTLERTNGNKTEAARLLGISLKTLYNKLHAHDLDISTGH